MAVWVEITWEIFQFSALTATCEILQNFQLPPTSEQVSDHYQYFALQCLAQVFIAKQKPILFGLYQSALSFMLSRNQPTQQAREKTGESRMQTMTLSHGHASGWSKSSSFRKDCLVQTEENIYLVSG